MERALDEGVVEFAEEHNLISQHQFEFRKGHLTVDQLISTYEEILHFLNDGKVVDLLFFDYTKAFDKVFIEPPNGFYRYFSHVTLCIRCWRWLPPRSWCS